MTKVDNNGNIIWSHSYGTPEDSDWGWDLFETKKIHSDCKEAFLMCVMAVSNQINLFSNMKKVTGSKKNIVLGEKYES